MKKQVRLLAHIKPERYEIFLKPDLNQFTFTGEETISLNLSKTTKKITLHSADLEIQSVEFIHKNKERWAGNISYNAEAETATFAFPKKLSSGKGQLKLIFKGILNDKMRGFYRSKYEVASQVKYLATTQFESTDARRAFPCFDEPSQKAIFDVTLMIPSGMTAISNTLESEILEHESGVKAVKFVPTPKMSSYLLAFIVGDFEFIEDKSKHGVLVRAFTTPGKKDQAKFALEVAKKCLDFYDDYFKIAYPLPVLDMIAIPDFAAGAMENWGAVTYRESALLVDEERSSAGNKQWVALVVAHELAHQWFGNLVTMEWWTHLWLNEGFASFIEYLAIDKIFPEWEVWNQFVALEVGEAFSLDALRNTHPIEVEVGHPAEISEIFDKVSYAKGASVLRMLWQYLGEKDFQNGLSHYLKHYAYSNARTEDLWQALEEVSGKPVKKVMKNWTAKSGHPLIKVEITGKRLRLTQSRFFSSAISKTEVKDQTIWAIPLKIKNERSEKELLMDKKSAAVEVSKKGWLKLNYGEGTLVRIDYPQKLLESLKEGVKTKQLPAVDRLGLVRDTFDLAQAGATPTTLALKLALSFTGEDDFTVWSQLSAHLNQLESLLALEPDFEDYKAFGRKIYQNIVAKMGWQKRPDEKHTDSLLRSMALFSLGSFGDLKIIKYAQELFGKQLDGKIKIDPDLRGVVYNLVAQNGGQKEFNLFLKMYKEEDNQQEKDRIGRALGLFRQKTILQKTLDFAISKKVRYQNSLQIIASVWHNPQGRYLSWQFIKKHWHLLKERYAGGHYFTRVFEPAGDFTKVSDAKEIEKFVSKNPVPEAKRTIAQALEQIYSNAEWLKRDQKKIAAFLVSLKANGGI